MSDASPPLPPSGELDGSVDELPPSSINPLGLLRGTVIDGRYRTGGRLGRGAMGVVYEATHQELDERVALKFLLPEHLGNSELVGRFAREARAAVKLKSEHVARVLDVGKYDERIPYIVMEYLDGGDLNRLVEQTGPLPVEAACGFTIEACAGLAEAHAKGIVHRDIKPENLFLARLGDGRERIKILDFGVSKIALTGSAIEPADLAATSTMLGSPLYMSPEQIRSRDVDHRTDIWSLGVSLYELLTGETPFHSATIAELIARVLEESPRPLHELRPDVPAELEAVIMRCLEPAADRRWENVALLAEALLPFAGGTPEAIAAVDQAFGFLARAGGTAGENAASSRMPRAPSSPSLSASMRDSGASSLRGSGRLGSASRSMVGSNGAVAVTANEDTPSSSHKRLILPAAALLFAILGGFFFGMSRTSTPADTIQPSTSTGNAGQASPSPTPSEASGAEIAGTAAPSPTAPPTEPSASAAAPPSPAATPPAIAKHTSEPRGKSAGAKPPPSAKTAAPSNTDGIRLTR